jgi:hypothetical protein
VTATEDRAEIMDVTARYARAIDTRDESALSELFQNGSVLELGPELVRPGGRATFRAPADLHLVVAAVRRFARTRHVVSQQTIELRGDRASALTYCDAHHVFERGGQWHDSVLVMRYNDDYVRSPGGWVFARRLLHADWSYETPVTQVVPLVAGSLVDG